MDILRIWFETYDGGKTIERSKIYHNIDPESIVAYGTEMYFAHPGSWQGNLLANRYRIPLKNSIIKTDPQAIKAYAESHKETINRGLYVTEAA